MIVIFLASTIIAASNESIEAAHSIAQAKINLIEIQERQIPTSNANESYQEALQLYDAQMALEELHKKARFDLIMEYTANVAEIKKVAFNAQDELNIFVRVFKSSNQSMNLSAMFNDYEAILQSFEEERFEDTINLIEEGYATLSEVQSSQTTFNIFYASTTKNIKDFFATQWKTILIIIGAIFLFLLLFWNTLLRLKIRSELHTLIIRRKSLKELIKKLQSDYFTHKNIPASSYQIKLKKFESMILDINRQIPLLKEDMVKIETKKTPTYLPKDKMKKSLPSGTRAKKQIRRSKINKPSKNYTSHRRKQN